MKVLLVVKGVGRWASGPVAAGAVAGWGWSGAHVSIASSAGGPGWMGG